METKSQLQNIILDLMCIIFVFNVK